MKLGLVVVPFLSVALAYAATPAPKHVAARGSYAVYIDNRLTASSSLTGGSGAGTSRALYALNTSLRRNLESVTYVRKAPAKVKPYDAVIILTPQGEATIARDTPMTGQVLVDYVIQKCNEPDQRGMITYDVAHDVLGGLPVLIKRAAATPAPTAASAGAQR